MNSSGPLAIFSRADLRIGPVAASLCGQGRLGSNLLVAAWPSRIHWTADGQPQQNRRATVDPLSPDSSNRAVRLRKFLCSQAAFNLFCLQVPASEAFSFLPDFTAMSIRCFSSSGQKQLSPQSWLPDLCVCLIVKAIDSGCRQRWRSIAVCASRSESCGYPGTESHALRRLIPVDSRRLPAESQARSGRDMNPAAVSSAAESDGPC